MSTPDPASPMILSAPPVASLPMYDPPALHAANDALFAALIPHLTAAGITAPRDLQRGAPVATLWRMPGLVLSQCCGFDWVHGVGAQSSSPPLSLVATPVYEAPGSEIAGSYRSAWVVPEATGATAVEELAPVRMAINGPGSWSGFHGPMASLRRRGLAPEQRISALIETGAHLSSLAAVQQGAADLAAIDGVSLALAQDCWPQAMAGLRVLGWTDPAPALPFITALPAPDADRLRAALLAAFSDPHVLAAARAVRLVGLVEADAAAYRRAMISAQDLADTLPRVQWAPARP